VYKKNLVCCYVGTDPEEVKSNAQLRICSFPDDQGCTFIFRYLIDNSTVEVQRKKQCGNDVNVLGKCYET
jgi:hypothetical protein